VIDDTAAVVVTAIVVVVGIHDRHGNMGILLQG
jgi:hypothetical protein